MTTSIELGLDTFDDIPVDSSGKRITDAEAIRLTVEEGRLRSVELYGTKVIPLVREMLADGAE